MSAFMDWFVKQHGPRNLWISEDSELQNIINHAAGAREELDRRKARVTQSDGDSDG